LTASANVKDPQTFNRYSYAMNSPYKFNDPLGLISRRTGAYGDDKDKIVIPKDLKKEVETKQVAATAGDKKKIQGQIVLPQSMIDLKKDLLNTIYPAKAAIGSQNYANSRNGGTINPQQEQRSEGNTTSSSETNKETGGGKIGMSKDGVTGEISQSKEKSTTSDESSNQANNVSGPSTDTTAAKKALDNEVNTKIVNYLNANADDEGNLEIQFIRNDGKSFDASWSRKDAEVYLRSYADSVGNRAVCDFNKIACP
jgi:hypothetical protein